MCADVFVVFVLLVWCCVWHVVFVHVRRAVWFWGRVWCVSVMLWFVMLCCVGGVCVLCL